ncbi:MAG: DinB family protein [Cyclobacteriaceae bacterium]
MEKTANELQEIITSFSPKIKVISSGEFNAKPNPAKWSKKEVLGHLIDSAHNNLRRFVAGQYEQEPNIVYDQDFWVRANDYQHMRDSDVIELWRLINERIVATLKNMPPEYYARACNTGKQSPSIHTIQWLASDYVKHLKHHLNQIIAGSFNITYP